MLFWNRSWNILKLTSDLDHPGPRYLPGLRSDGSMGIVGGPYDENPESDLSFVDAKKVVLRDLPQDKASKLTLSFVVSCTDSNRHTFDVCMIPRTRGDGKAEKVLHLLGRVLLAGANANNQLPLLGVSFDGGGCNSAINACLLGLMEESQLTTVPFWNQCQFEGVPLPCFPYRRALWKGHPLLGSNGALHVFKRWSLQHQSGVRIVEYGSFFADMSHMLLQGLPAKAFSCTDGQSDKQAAQRSNPAWSQDTFDAHGNVIAMFVGALFMSGSAASHAFSTVECAENLMASYYLILFQVHRAWMKYASRWEERFLPLQTCRNTLALIAHSVMALLYHDDAAITSKHQEGPVEWHFSKIKSSFRGAPTVRDGIIGTQLLHMRQLKMISSEARKRDKPKAAQPSRRALTLDELQDFAKKSLKNAAVLHCSIDIGGQKPVDAASSLLAWWNSTGNGLLTKGHGGPEVWEMDFDEQPDNLESSDMWLVWMLDFCFFALLHLAGTDSINCKMLSCSFL